MNLQSDRKFLNLSNKRMRRARRLYTYLVFEEAIKSSENLIFYATKAKHHGLWSAGTGDRDCCFHFAAYLCKHFVEANPNYLNPPSYLRDWHAFRDEFDYLWLRIEQRKYAPYRYKGL